jgi:hypothetical protein
MRAVAEALEHLPDAESRARVLKWAAEFFKITDVATSDPATPAAAVPVRAPRTSSDPGLSVKELSSFFEDEAPTEEPQPQAPTDAKGGVTSMLKNLASDFQKLARDWKE